MAKGDLIDTLAIEGVFYVRTDVYDALAARLGELQRLAAWQAGLLTEIESKPHRAEEVAARWRAESNWCYRP